MPTILALLGFIACLLALGAGIVATMGGAIVAVLSQPADRIMGCHPVAVGVTSAMIGLLVFMTAALVLARSLL